jgi:serine protease AprX
LRKAIVVVVASVMVLGTLASAFYFLFQGTQPDPTSSGPLSDIPEAVVRSFRYSDFSHTDISELDLSTVGDEILTYTFSSETKWPAPERMPPEYSPDRIMSLGKDLGLGLTALHESGITGRGIPVAVIDKPIIEYHEAYSGGLRYIEVNPGAEEEGEAHFHGAACATILAGDYGVAPEAPLYYFAVPDGPEPYRWLAEAMKMLLDMREEMPEEEKIRIVSVSYGIHASEAGASEWLDAIARAEEQGVIVVYPGMPGLSFTGAGCLPNLDRDDPANYKRWSWVIAKEQVVGKLIEAGVSSFEEAREELKRLLTSDPEMDVLRVEAIHTFLYMIELAKFDPAASYEEYLWAMVTYDPETLAVPVDYLTVAGASSPLSYTYYGAGGLSWATPYLAGVLALGLQVNPSATPEDLFAALLETAWTFGQEGVQGKLLNPKAFVDALK